MVLKMISTHLSRIPNKLICKLFHGIVKNLKNAYGKMNNDISNIEIQVQCAVEILHLRWQDLVATFLNQKVLFSDILALMSW